LISSAYKISTAETIGQARKGYAKALLLQDRLHVSSEVCFWTILILNRIMAAGEAMPDLQTLTSRDIEWYIGSDLIVERGRNYYHLGRVFDLELTTDEHLRAKVYGQYQKYYKVEVWSEDEELYSECTCPYEWGVCKHVAAVLYAWLDRREKEALPESSGEEAEGRVSLEAIPREVLLDLLAEEMRTNSAVEKAVARWIEALAPARLPQRIAALFRGMISASPAWIERNVEKIDHLLIWAKSFEPSPAARIASETLSQAAQLMKVRKDVDLKRLIKSTIDLLRAHSAGFSQNRRLERKIMLGLLEIFLIGDPAQRLLIGPAIVELSESSVRRADLISELEHRIIGADAGAYALLAKLCKLEGRINDYEVARKKSLITEEDYLELFDHYVSENRSEEAMVIGEKGIKALGSRARNLAERLAALYKEWGEAERARAILDS